MLGALLGGLYTLFATGLSLSAGVMRFVFVTHGDLIVLALLRAADTDNNARTTTLGLDPVVAAIVALPRSV